MISQEGAKILGRVDMWCSRFYTEAREGALAALAAGDLFRYRILTREKYEWLDAALVVRKVMDLEKVS